MTPRRDICRFAMSLRIFGFGVAIESLISVVKLFGAHAQLAIHQRWPFQYVVFKKGSLVSEAGEKIYDKPRFDN